MIFKKIWKKNADINEFNTNISNLNGALQVFAMNLVIPFVIMFAKRLNASDLQVALLNSLPAAVSIGAIIPGAIFIGKYKNKKNVTGAFFILTRVFYLLFAIVPFFFKEYRALLFVILYGLMNLPGSIANVAWQSFIAEIFPPQVRANTLAIRNKVATLVGIITTLVTGWLLYNIPRNDGERIVLYQIFFAAAFIIALIEIYVFYKHKEPKVDELAITKATVNPIERLKNAIKDLKGQRKFLSFCLFAALYHVSWYMSWPLFPIYEIDYLHSNEAWTSIIASIAGLSSAITYPYWGKLAAKKGNMFALSMSILTLSVTPLTYPIINSIYIAAFLGIFGGAGSAGLLLITLNALYEVSPEDNRTMHIAYFNTMLNVLLAVSPFIGVTIKDAANIYVALGASGVMRLLSGVVLFVKHKKEMRALKN